MITNTKHMIFTFLFFSVLVLQHPCHVASQETEDESEFNYDNESGKGPAHWGEIHSEWRNCSNGSMQSPIDLMSHRVQIVSHLGRLRRRYKPANATLRNRGHDIELRWEGGAAGSLEINGTEYFLRQLHWHSPSEHTINDRRYNLELHMVHESTDARITVMGIMYKIGRPDSFLSSLTEGLSAITDTSEAERPAGLVDPRRIAIGSRKYYRYLGSLTTPPCTEGVVWNINWKVRTASREQIRLLRVAVHDESNTNARPRQSINNRLVQLYRPNDKDEH